MFLCALEAWVVRRAEGRKEAPLGGASRAYFDDLPFLAGADFDFFAGDCEDDFVDFLVALFIEWNSPLRVITTAPHRNVSRIQTQDRFTVSGAQSGRKPAEASGAPAIRGRAGPPEASYSARTEAGTRQCRP
jgi:hypothetical protein